ncbi:MAG: pyridoxamine 5'-phosphate oxidase family protein [Phaeodactylibacter sp.]|nr:pyridoxamine 5'-phosphate oxidase family protein [Phaeodactylibacter sp.]
MELFELAKAELLRSNADHRHTFRYFSLATFGLYPEVRTVVAREVSQGLSVLFFTDSRTPKVAQIRENPRVSALFYHPKKKLQVRMKGWAELIDEENDEYGPLLERIKNSDALKDYTALQAPGSKVMDTLDVIYGEGIHFMAVRITPQQMDVLQLGRNQHQRRGYTLEDGEWKEAILIP